MQRQRKESTREGVAGEMGGGIAGREETTHCSTNLPCYLFSFHPEADLNSFSASHVHARISRSDVTISETKFLLQDFGFFFLKEVKQSARATNDLFLYSPTLPDGACCYGYCSINACRLDCENI